MPQPDVELRQWEGRELPVWRFDTYVEMEQFMAFASPLGEDPPPWVAEIFPDWPETMWGVIYRHEPMEPANAIALIHIAEEDAPACQCGCAAVEHAFEEEPDG